MTSIDEVGIHVGNNKHSGVNFEATGAVNAALKVKHETPSAMITYTRRRDRREDLRRTHKDIAEKLRMNETVQLLVERGDRLRGH